jgi:hypothetical protein
VRRFTKLICFPNIYVINISTYKPTTHRFVAVLNKKCENGRLFNVLGHITAGLVGLHTENARELNFTQYNDKDGNIHHSISDNPFIVLKADNGNKIRTLRNQLLDKNIKFTDFTNTMIDGSAETQHSRTMETLEQDLDYYGICFFTDFDIAKELTKKFSLFN